MTGNKQIHMITFLLVIIGGVNWLIIGLSGGYNVIDTFLPATIARVVYILVGLSAVYELTTHKGNCKLCGTGAQSTGM